MSRLVARFLFLAAAVHSNPLNEGYESNLNHGDLIVSSDLNHGDLIVDGHFIGAATFSEPPGQATQDCGLGAQFKRNFYCDAANNNVGCEYDGGDCCGDQCRHALDGYPCDCNDPRFVLMNVTTAVTMRDGDYDESLDLVRARLEDRLCPTHDVDYDESLDQERARLEDSLGWNPTNQSHDLGGEEDIEEHMIHAHCPEHGQPPFRPPNCQHNGIVGCTRINITEQDIINRQTFTLPNGMKLWKQSSSFDPSTNTTNAYHRTSENVEAIFTMSNGIIFGHIPSTAGMVYAIEYCGEGCHSFVKKNMTAIDRGSVSPLTAGLNVANIGVNHTIPYGRKKRQSDIDAITVTGKIYYTSNVANSIVNMNEDGCTRNRAINSFFEHVFAVANRGLTNSGLNIKFEMVDKCAELKDSEDVAPTAGRRPLIFEDTVSLEKILLAFAGTDPDDFNRRRNGADFAILFVNREFAEGAGGNAIRDSASNGETFGVVRKTVAISNYGFGHEVGHMFGALHNFDLSLKKKDVTRFPFGFGIRREIGKPCKEGCLGKKQLGVRTIMSYVGDESVTYDKRNFYSNPAIDFRGLHQRTFTNTRRTATTFFTRKIATGVAGAGLTDDCTKNDPETIVTNGCLARDNARVLEMQAMAMANVGNEISIEAHICQTCNSQELSGARPFMADFG